MASAYPTGLDSFATNKANNTLQADDHPAHHNDLADAVNKIEAELGINPSGTDATVVARLGVTPRVLAQSAVQVVAPANTSENTLATITVPANVMGANGRLRIWTVLTCTNNANAKTLRFRFSGAAGTIVASEGLASVAELSLVAEIANRNATNSQHAINHRKAFFAVASSTTAAIDTTAATTIVITIQKATGADVVNLESYAVELLT